jgi:hypothetical protein
MSKVKNLLSMRFGRLVVIADAGKGKRCWMWSCLCDCGATKTIPSGSLTSGDTKSCGCLRRDLARNVGDRSRTHGKSKQSIYAIWDSMIARCTKPSRKDFHRYGGTGVTVCDRWKTFQNFYDDMGDRPPGMSLDRIRNDQGYSPENCRWATTKQQNRNQKSNLLLTSAGETRCLAEWAEIKGIKQVTLHCRLRRGWDVDKALNTPIERKYSHAKNMLRHA